MRAPKTAAEAETRSGLANISFWGVVRLPRRGFLGWGSAGLGFQKGKPPVLGEGASQRANRGQHQLKKGDHTHQRPFAGHFMRALVGRTVPASRHHGAGSAH